mgnify:CR=1 FL=1
MGAPYEDDGKKIIIIKTESKWGHRSRLFFILIGGFVERRK